MPRDLLLNYLKGINADFFVKAAIKLKYFLYARHTYLIPKHAQETDTILFPFYRFKKQNKTKLRNKVKKQ